MIAKNIKYFVTLGFFVNYILCMGTTMVVAFNMSTMSFSEGFTHLFGNDNLVRSSDDRSASLSLNRYSGSGFISTDLYDHGFFSASIKLPEDYSAGVVVAFYTSNGDIYPNTHDELDFEFLGNIRGKEWRIQTNIYGNGSTKRGREERYILPFDPTVDAHQYSILWTPDYIMYGFYIDDIPIREVHRSSGIAGDYPSKPMAVYATIWDGSCWATENGQYKVDYNFSPFITDFSNFVLRGCRSTTAVQTLDEAGRCAEQTEDMMTEDYAVMTKKKRDAMKRFRERNLVYSVCYDTNRYPEGLPDCESNGVEEKNRFWRWGVNKNFKEKRRIKKRRPTAINMLEVQGYFD